jgi:hypothetical protein
MSGQCGVSRSHFIYGIHPPASRVALTSDGLEAGGWSILERSNTVELRTVTLPETVANIGLFRSKWVTLPAIEHTYAPTLVRVHKWLFDEGGPFYWSWFDGALCAFAPQVGTKNITCSEGRRRYSCSLTGDNGRIICYPWCHEIAMAYWSISRDELLQFPDNPQLVAFSIMRRVFRKTGWFDWKRELHNRQTKPNHIWLQPIPTR